MSGAVEGVDFIESSTRRVAFRTRTVLNSQQLSDFYAGRPVEGAEDVSLSAAPVVVNRMDDPLERWPGYHEQSWQERFNELNRRYNERTVQLDVALCKVGLARLTTPPARSYADGVEEAAHRIYDACRPEHPLPYHVCETLAAAAGVPTTASADLQKLIDAIAIWDQSVVEYKPRHAVFEYGNALRNAARSVLASFTTPTAQSCADNDAVYAKGRQDGYAAGRSHALDDAAQVADEYEQHTGDPAFDAATDVAAVTIGERIRLLSQGGKA